MRSAPRHRPSRRSEREGHTRARGGTRRRAIAAGAALALALLGAAVGGRGKDRPEGGSPSRAGLEARLSAPWPEGRRAREVALDLARSRIPVCPTFSTPVEHEAWARDLRRRIIDEVILRGERAREWSRAPCRVEWRGEIETIADVRVRKLRYEALPGLWIPALLYEPSRPAVKAGAILNVNGHDPQGKAASYKQLRVVHQARRGFLALNVEWFGMGQLRADGFSHDEVLSLDLCGVGGVAPFWLAIRRALDLLLADPRVDPARVGVTGLSGGGWQTILAAALDGRVRLANPVAGYGSYLSRIDHPPDLGDPEQMPCDLALLGEYTHLTAMVAPRPLLLTYNVRDNCCFLPAQTLPPLLEAARPAYALHDATGNLRTWVNQDPGTHNFERENRAALYTMLERHFLGRDAPETWIVAEELAGKSDLRSAEDLQVELPDSNRDLHSIALEIAEELPRAGPRPRRRSEALQWQEARRRELARLLRANNPWEVTSARKIDQEPEGRWRLEVADWWPVWGAELGARAEGTTASRRPAALTLLVADVGVRGSAPLVAPLLAAGRDVFVFDSLGFGAHRLSSRFNLLLASLGERPLGLQARQIAAVARWARGLVEAPRRVELVASGPVPALSALVAAALEPGAFDALELSGCPATLRELVERRAMRRNAPELYAFGLLERFDVVSLVELAAPVPVRFRDGAAPHREELSSLASWYGLLGRSFDPLARPSGGE